MPVSKNALIRYKTIDRCLQNHYRRWTLDDLIAECSDALSELTGRDENISRRTIQGDLKAMKDLYNAPIKLRDHKYFIYEDEDFSITESPLSAQDVAKMGEAVNVLRQLSGFHEFSGMQAILSRLEDIVHVSKERSKPVIFFDKNDLLKGLEYIEPLHAAILDKHPLKMTYKSFRARVPSTFTFHPYALREFNNRWFIYGRRANKPLENLALDRIVELTDAPKGTEYMQDPSFDPEDWFKDMVGVTRFTVDKPERIVFWASPGDAPYIETKPFHHSQRIIEKREDGSMVFELNMIINRELVRLLLGFAEGIKVLKPRKLVYAMKSHFQHGAQLYETKGIGEAD